MVTVGDVLEGLAAALATGGSFLIVGVLVSWLAGLGVALIILSFSLVYFAQVWALVPVSRKSNE